MLFRSGRPCSILKCKRQKGSGGSASVCLWAATKLTYPPTVLRRDRCIRRLCSRSYTCAGHSEDGSHASRFHGRLLSCPPCPPRGSTWRNTSPRRPHWVPCRRRVTGSLGRGRVVAGSTSGERRATQRYGYCENCHLIGTRDLDVLGTRPAVTSSSLRELCEKGLGETLVSAKSNLAPFSLFFRRMEP